MTPTTSPIRAAHYVRVSTEEQVDGYSLDAQARAIADYCAKQGWTIARTYADEGASARTDDLARRPKFAQMLADAEAGLLDVIVVHKLDRFSRNLRVTLETLERLQRCQVGFVSISEQMDFTTPIGKVMLATLAAFAQYYSDNLSTEVRKGKAERKAQGLYNGVLPFGLKKNSAGLPVPDPETYPGLLLAFRLAADGKSDRQVAEALNAAGYRTTGNRGRNLFTKDTVCRLLKNRFYLGELPDGQCGSRPAAHEAVLDDALFAAALQARQANRSGAVKVPRTRRRHSLSGLGLCGHCGGRLHILTDRRGQARIYCYQRRQTDRCPQRSLPLTLIEAQLSAYLSTFQLPEEMVARIVALYEQARDSRDDADRTRRELAHRLARSKELYRWGDLTREAYLAEKGEIETALATVQRSGNMAALLTQAATFLRDLPAAWDAASPEQRNDLARLVFVSVEVKEDQVVAVVVKPEFAPFFVAQAADTDNTAGSSDRGGVNLLREEAEATGVARVLSQ